MTGRTRTRIVLTVLAGLLVVANLAFVGVKQYADGLLPASWTAAERADSRNAEVLLAARRAVQSFVDTDYRTIEKDLDRMTGLSTGTFKKQFEATRAQYISLSKQTQAVGTGKVVEVGLVRASADTALATVAVNQTVLNKSVREAISKGEKVDNVRLFTFQLTLNRVGKNWLLANLEVIG